MKIFFKVLVVSVVALLSVSCNQENSEKSEGIALYTLRDAMATNPKEVLREVSELGYDYIEDAGYADGKFYGMSPQEFKAYLEEVGLEPVSSHQSGITYENADQIIADLKTVGFEYLVIPIPPMGHFTFDMETRSMGMTGGAENLAQILNTIGEKCKAAGIKLLYHNHDFELKPDADGVVVLDYLLAHTDPAVVNFEIDLYWTAKAEADALKYFEKYPGRFVAWHLKDMDSAGQFAPIGEGQLDFASYLTKKEQAGMKYFFVEQDMTFDGMTPMEAVTISHKAITELGYK